MVSEAFLLVQPEEFNIDRALSRGFRRFRRSTSFPSYEATYSLSLYERSSLADISPTLPDAWNEEPEDGYKLKIHMREVLSTFKSHRPHVNRQLMKEAQRRFPKEFPKECQYLYDFVKAQKELSRWSKPQNIGKIWNLMELAHNLMVIDNHNFISKDNLALQLILLMEKTYKLFPNVFPCGQLRIEMKLIPGFLTKGSSTERNLRTLSNSIHLLLLRPDSHAKLVDLLKLVRNLFPKEFPQKALGELLGKVHELFPKEFPPVPLSNTFTGTVAILEEREATVKDKEVVTIIKNKLAFLQGVAMRFEWSKIGYVDTKGRTDADADAYFGEAFFYLCKGVGRSNFETFHMKVFVRELTSNAMKGKYMVEDHNVGLAVLGIFSITMPRP